MSYNVQAFFDDVDHGTEYSDYDPGTGNWDKELFFEKARKISSVIKKSVPGGPDIIALQEVENANALEILCNSGLKGLGYRYRIIVPVRQSATNTAILSRISIQRVRAYSLRNYCGMPVRKIVEIELSHNGKVLYLFNNHWKSKLGGSFETEASRREAAALIVARVNDILSTDSYADIIVLGDLNENRDEFIETGRTYQTALIPLNEGVPAYYKETSLFLSDSSDFTASASPTTRSRKAGNTPGNKNTQKAMDNSANASVTAIAYEHSYRDKKSWNNTGIFAHSNTEEPGQKTVFYEPWYEKNLKTMGSYVYRKEWQTPDHILLSRGLFHEQGFVYIQNSFRVIDFPFLLDSDTGYPIAWTHNRENHGYSDHLPLIITVLCTNS